MRALTYFFEEALSSLWRGAKTALIAIATITAAFTVLGGFLVVTTNLERLISRWQEAAEFSVYLRDGSTPAERTSIERALRDSGLVLGLDTISKDEALRRFKQHFG